MNLQKKNYLRKLLRTVAVAVCAAGALMGSSPAFASLTFDGVAAGDATSSSVTLWTRAVDSSAPAAAALNLQITTDPSFATGVTTSAAGSTDPLKDYTLKASATSLQPATVYYYRFQGPSGELSIVGKVKTAPLATAVTPVHFAFSGDMDGLIRPYALASTIPAQNFDFYSNVGDTIYETASASTGNNGASYLNSPAVTSTGSIPAPSATGATQAQLFTDFSRKYHEQFLPVNTGGQNGLQPLYASQGCYTVYDNHELGNKQYINGGAPAGGPVGDFTTGAGVDARLAANDVASAPFMNQSGGFLTLQQVFLNYQPIADHGLVSAPSDPRTNGTKRLYFAQQWGKNAIFVNTDCRTYRDIRMKTSANADDTGSRADNPSRTYLGVTQLAWLEQTLLSAQQAGTPWKFITISDPIDQIGPIGGALSGVVNSSGNAAYAPVASDGGKSWIGGYRAERNALLKFIADHQITNVVFLATDDHQNRINELTYSPTGQTSLQSSYVKVPYCFEIVCGPLGATGPDLFLNHDFNSIKTIADSIATAQTAAGIEPIGLAGYPGLHNVVREGDTSSTPSDVDFYSPDTFNYNILDVTPDGKTLTVTSMGIKSTAQNSALEYDAVNNPAHAIFSFQVDAATPINNIQHIIVVYQENWSFDALYGSFPGANGIANASATSLNQLDLHTGNPISSLSVYNNVNRGSTAPVQIPPAPLNGSVDTRFLTNPADPTSPTLINTLLPYSLTDPVLAGVISPSSTTGDIVHRYWQEQFQINGGNNNAFVTWSDNPGLVMSHFDATSLPEGLLAQQYTMCDNFFHSAFGGSFLNHQFLIAAQAPVYPNAASVNSGAIATLDANGVLKLDTVSPNVGKLLHDGSITPIGGEAYSAPAGTTFDKNYVVNTSFSVNLATSTTAFPGGNPPASLIPSQNDSNPAGPNYIPTIGDRLSASGISWKWYSGGWNDALASSPSNPTHYGNSGPNTVNPLFQWHHQPFAFYDNYAPFVSVATYTANPAAYPGGFNPNSAAHLQDEANLYTDISGNTLPSVSFVKFLGPDNEHPGYASLQEGQQHVAALVAAVQANPSLWAHTAIIITYDEHGGRWDHVAPPTRDIWGPGVRVPAIVISPYAKQGYVDHTQYETSSILSTIEQRFGVPALNQVDTSATSMAGIFTNSQIGRGALTLNGRTHKMTQSVTVTNLGSTTTIGPIQLVLDSLSSNTTLTNASGVTANNAPTGSPYITVSSGSLAPGASATVTLQFTIPSSGTITYSPRTVTGTPNP